MHQLKGKTREQVLEILGSNYISEYGGDLWVYTLNKPWFRRQKILMIEFDNEGIAIHIEKANDEE